MLAAAVTVSGQRVLTVLTSVDVLPAARACQFDVERSDVTLEQALLEATLHEVQQYTAATASMSQGSFQAASRETRLRELAG